MKQKRADKTMTCRICNLEADHPTWAINNPRERHHDESFTYFQCKSCGCLQIETVPENLSDYYEDSYYSLERVSERKLFDPSWKRYMRKAGACVGTSTRWYGRLTRKLFTLPVHHEWFSHGNVSFSSRILDVGCGSAAQLVRIWKEGFHSSMGIDPFIEEDILYGNGLMVKKIDLDGLSGEKPYDFIMMNHSLEHIPDQYKALNDLSRILKPDGCLLVRVPVSSSYAWEHYREYWSCAVAPEHLYLHSEKSIKVLAKKTGFRLSEVVYDSQGFQFWGSELCKMGIPFSEHQKNVGRFTKKQLKDWEDEAKRLNTEHRGDMACFYLVKA